MKIQEYLDKSIDEAKIYSENLKNSQEEYAKLFPETGNEADVREVISKMNDDELMRYFKASQIQLDVQTSFQKIAALIYFSKHTEIELDLTKLTEVERLPEFIAGYSPFYTGSVVIENEIKERDNKITNEKFKSFKNSLGLALQMVT